MTTNTLSVTLAGHPEHSYQQITQEQINIARDKHAWLVLPIERASDHVLDMPFFPFVKSLKSARDFSFCAQQLWHHSATFPKVMGLMLGLTPLSENSMMEFYAAHAYGEATHHEMLMQWMLKQKILSSREDIQYINTTIETNACINFAYQLAVEQNRNKWLAALNSGIERCSNQFFKIVAPKMHELDAGDMYFDCHVEADEHHSVMGLEYLDVISSAHERAVIIAKALEGISLWAAMLHSWIGSSIIPYFDIYGNLIKTQSKY